MPDRGALGRDTCLAGVCANRGDKLRDEHDHGLFAQCLNDRSRLVLARASSKLGQAINTYLLAEAGKCGG